ncbi:hemagglutinin protein [Lacinutrix sp. Bg11-31]|uniref:hemagglutinin protein n=1 Tax=Lacinutrix sp. Bg11-31 TaxID=2057808 RepID=UPI000C301BBF|nr:hemagglutinin protein [Lacinutrix sp. Bg11-31]AUC83637.1 hemagglutinin protein [Lacinutrix sp. Bg11-31]
MKTIFVILLVWSYSFSSVAQSIEKFSIDSGGASTITPTIQMVYTIGEVNAAERATATVKISEGFLSRFIKIKINPKVFLQGASLNPETVGLMNDDLRDLGLLPTTSPFGDGKTVDVSVFNLGGTTSLGEFEDDIVDWIWLEFRNETDVSQIIKGTSVLLQRDGDIVALDGVSDISLGMVPKNYYVVLQHRNHLGVMSANPIAVTEIGTAINFTENTTPTFGSNAQVALANGDLALWTGDTNYNGEIRFSGSDNDSNIIKDAVLNDPSNGFNSATYTSTGYLLIDLDLSGGGRFSGSNNDSNIIKDNVLQHPNNGFNSPTFTINTTVPVGN